MSSQSRALSTHQLIDHVRSSDQDFEWYPTTTQILDVIKGDIGEQFYDAPTVLDCGAGDGRSLMRLTGNARYAIEKSRPLLDILHESIFIVGTDFHQQTLIDKKVDVVFCNPPYSEYIDWMFKIIREANAKVLYFVVPTRWEKSELAQGAIELRSAKAESLGQFDFLNADRQARVEVSIVRIKLSRGTNRNDSASVDPFSVWFDENFKLQINNTETSRYAWSEIAKNETQGRLDGELVEGRDLATALENLYQSDLSKLLANYRALESIDPALLRELDVNISSVRGALRQKIEGLKDVYWSKFFDNLDKITLRLTHKARRQMLDKLTQYTHVDFTASNAYAILIWVLKNANAYFDDQLVTLVERMTEKANVKLYKSNQTTFRDEDWRYCRTPGGLDRYSLDYRIILDRVGGVSCSEYSCDRTRYNGLVEGSFNFLGDILTIANNVGFDTTHTDKITDFEWQAGKAVTFSYRCHLTQRDMELMHVRAFKNGNLHIKFNQSFICRLNVEFGRLKGWLKSTAEASRELEISEEDAACGFGSNLRLDSSRFLLLAAPC